MIKKIANLFKRKLYIVTDSSDNSVTVNEALYNEIHKDKSQTVHIFVFRVGNTYGFRAVDEAFAKTTQCGELQYNSKFRTIGFECLTPSVNYIYYKFDLSEGKHRLRVIRKQLPDKTTYYQIVKP